MVAKAQFEVTRTEIRESDEQQVVQLREDHLGRVTSIMQDFESLKE
jgi:hypothetical protein